MTTGFGEESESESEEEQCREPGEPGTSLPNLELSLSLSSALSQPILVPVTPGLPGMHRPLTANNRPPTKLRRIEPKPMAGVTTIPTSGMQTAVATLEQQSPVMQQNQQQTAMMVPLTVVTVPQVATSLSGILCIITFNLRCSNSSCSFNSSSCSSSNSCNCNCSSSNSSSSTCSSSRWPCLLSSSRHN